MTFNRTILVYIFFALVATACNQSNQQELQLKLSSFDDVDEIDTIEAYPGRGLYVLQVVRKGGLGHFSTRLVFEKHIKQLEPEKLRYELDDNLQYRVSKDFISFVETEVGELNWGWFQVLNGKVVGSLPNAEKIHDSLKETNKNYFVQETGGYYTFYDNGSCIKTLNYGNFITKLQDLNFDSLDYNLYKVTGDSLVTASKNGNDLLAQKDGVYFIPKPGYKVKSMYSKKAILRLLDSVSRSSSPPTHLFIKPV